MLKTFTLLKVESTEKSDNISAIRIVPVSTPKAAICPKCGGEVLINKPSGRGFCISCDYKVSGQTAVIAQQQKLEDPPKSNSGDSQNVCQRLKSEIVQKFWNGENDHLTCKEFCLKYPEFESLFESLS